MFSELCLGVEEGSREVCSADMAAFWRALFLAVELFPAFGTELRASTFRFVEPFC
jgi:hypothetical protein